MKYSNVFKTLLTPDITAEEFDKAVKELPHISDFFDTDETKEEFRQANNALRKSQSEYRKCYDENGTCINEQMEMQLRTEIEQLKNQLEALREPAEDKLCETVQALTNSNSFKNSGSAESMPHYSPLAVTDLDLPESEWPRILGTDDPTIAKKLSVLPPYFYATLKSALRLHNIYDRIQKSADSKTESNNTPIYKIDYCPVALLYCKLIEAMLKEGFTPIYINRLGDKTIKKNGIKFNQLGSPEHFNITNKGLTIGSFTSCLTYLDDKKISLDHPQVKPRKEDFEFTKHTFANGNTEVYSDNLMRLVDKMPNSKQLIDEWKPHAVNLTIIRTIRNRSAHETIDITRENFDWLIDVMFSQGELLKIWQLADY